LVVQTEARLYLLSAGIKMKRLGIIILFAVFQNTSYGQNLCDKKWICNNLELIQSDAKNILLQSPDDCVLRFLDTLNDLYNTTKELQFINTLDAVCKISDGYVSEYFWGITDSLIEKSFKQYVHYLAEQPNQCLEKFILQAYSNSERRKYLIDKIDTEINYCNPNIQTRDYLILLKEKFSK
jgi:hypothetical protein